MPETRIRILATLATAAVVTTALLATALLVSAQSRLERDVVATSTRPNIPSGQARANAMVDRGRYLVRITGCNDCHTDGYMPKVGNVPEALWLTGGRVGWQGPWGTTYPPNLRLYVQRLTPEQWLTQARRTMRPPMPWFALRHMKDEDLLAIYHFIRWLGPAGKPAPAYVPPGEPVRTPVARIPAP